MVFSPQKPIIVQSDRTVLLEVDNPAHDEARDALVLFAELVKSPEHVHTYRISPLSLWNAAAIGLTADRIVESLETYSQYPVPQNVRVDIRDWIGRYGRLVLTQEDGHLVLRADEPLLITEIVKTRVIERHMETRVDPRTLHLGKYSRGLVKQALLKIGFPVKDLAGYVSGDPFPMALRERSLGGEAFSLREYQRQAVSAFHCGGSVEGGSGVIVLPCGAGKTVVGMGAMAEVESATLILVTNTIALRQWVSEIMDKMDVSAEDVAEYSGEVKNVGPVTVATYQILTHRKRKSDDFKHFALINQHNWGLIIYDEVHLLPAPVFRVTADIQARRRLGLTATLVREDGREDDVFSLIGPKRFESPWKVLEEQGWIATAECHEIRVPLDPSRRIEYAVANRRGKYRVAAENPGKLPVVDDLLEKHSDDQILIIGQYISQLKGVAKRYDVPFIHGQTPNEERQKLYQAFREGEIHRLVVSKVANFAIDLPDANVAIQISGTFGSRQEEAQRLGRILRPKKDGVPAHFYSVVTRETLDQDYSANRQLFLTEQGYRYEIEEMD
jgi:DNA excision repair protein ERCC-3